MNKPFDTSNWVYGPMITTLRQLTDTVQSISFDDALNILLDGGGKALSLKVCEIIVRDSHMLRVPEWLAMSVSQQRHWSDDQLNGWIAEGADTKVRSSTTEEDWLSGEAGKHVSRRAGPCMLYDSVREITHWSAPVVLQRYQEGIGIVVDIAYSHLLEKVVVRVATGREAPMLNKKRTFTSATWDHEGRYELFDPMDDMRPIVPTRVGVPLEGTCLTLPLRELAMELFTRVQAIGITFGVQLELVVDPEAPTMWHLLQIRPSPNFVRCDGLMNALDNTVVLTPIVSKSFKVIGHAQLLTPEDAFLLMKLEFDPDNPELEQLKARLRETPILVWEQDPHIDFGRMQLGAAAQSGALLQVTRAVMLCNTTHDQVREYKVDEQERILSKNGIIAVPDEVHQFLIAALREGPRTLHAISDGIVGQIALP